MFNRVSEKYIHILARGKLIKDQTLASDLKMLRENSRKNMQSFVLMSVYAVEQALIGSDILKAFFSQGRIQHDERD